MNQLIKKAMEYNKAICLAFVDHEKAFDSVKYIAVLNLMQEQETNENYVKFTENIYKSGTSLI